MTAYNAPNVCLPLPVVPSHLLNEPVCRSPTCHNGGFQGRVAARGREGRLQGRSQLEMSLSHACQCGVAASPPLIPKCGRRLAGRLGSSPSSRPQPRRWVGPPPVQSLSGNLDLSVVSRHTMFHLGHRSSIMLTKLNVTA